MGTIYVLRAGGQKVMDTPVIVTVRREEEDGDFLEIAKVLVVNFGAISLSINFMKFSFFVDPWKQMF